MITTPTAGSTERLALEAKMRNEGKTAMLCEATAAVYVTRDNMRDLQEMVIELQMANEELSAAVRYQREYILELVGEINRLKERRP